MNQKPITMKFRISGGIDGVIPLGVVEDLTINVRDGSATFHFKDSKITKNFIFKTKKIGEYKTEYAERLQVGIIFYPDMNQQEIVKKITLEMKDLQSHKIK